MNILLVTSKFLPEYSGPAHRIYNTYNRLNKIIKINLKVFCQSEEFNNYQNYNYKNIKVCRLKKFSSTDKNFINKIMSQIEFFFLLIFFCIKLNNKKFDILHIVGSSNITTAALYVSKIKKIPIFYELVNASSSPLQINRFINVFYKLNLSQNSVISCLSNKLKLKCNKYGLIDNIWVRPNPVDEKIFFFKKNINKNPKLIKLLNINQFIPRKNQIFLIEVMNFLPENYQLILAGPLVKSGNFMQRDKEYLLHINELIDKFQLRKRVKVINEFINPKDYYYLSDFYLMPSINEGLGTTFLESLACGIPVFANKDESVFNEWITNNYNGKLINLNAKKWSNEILKFPIQSNKQRLEISERIIEKVGSKKFDNKKVKLLKLLKGYKKYKKININA